MRVECPCRKGNHARVRPQRRVSAAPLVLLFRYAPRGPRPGHDALPMQHLPADVLRAIFALIPIRPRVLVLRVVCRRWSIAVTQSITSLGPSLLSGLLARPELQAPFVNLSMHTSLPQNHTADVTLLGTNFYSRIRSLHIVDKRSLVCRHFLDRCVSLTELEATYSNEMLDSYGAVARNARTIERLVLRIPPSTGTRLHHLELPMIRSLNLDFQANDSSSAQRFVERHLSSLTELATEAIDWAGLATAPRLRTLRLGQDVTDCADLRRWLSSLPSLTALHTSGVLSRGFMEFASSWLASVTLSDEQSYGGLGPALRSLRLLGDVGALLPLVRGAAPHIRSLSVVSYDSAMGTMCQMLRDVTFPELSELRLSVSDLPVDALLEFTHYPSLRTLQIDRAAIKMAVLALLVDTCTHLRTLAILFDPTAESGRVHLTSLANEPYFPAFDAALFRAERNGLESMRLAYCGGWAAYKMAVRHTQRKLRWLSLEIT